MGHAVMKVAVSKSATDSPAVLVADPSGMSTNLERLIRAAGHKVPETKPTLEVNPHSMLVRALKHESAEKRFADWSHILFDRAVLAECGQLDEPGVFVRRLNELMLEMAGIGKRIWTPD